MRVSGLKEASGRGGMEQASNGVARSSREKQVEILAEKFKGKMVVSVRGDTWRKAEKDLQWAIVMKLSMHRNYRQHELVSTMSKAWDTERFKIVELTGGMMVTKFEAEKDMKRALEEGPWSFKGATVLMVRWWQGCVPENLVIKHLDIWVQVHKLPFALRDVDIAVDFAEMAGEVLKKVKQEPDAEIHKVVFLRYKIRWELDKPLFGGCYMKLENGEYVWVEMRYERMPSFCQRCGRIDHVNRGCSAVRGDQEEGRWIRGLDNNVFFEVGEEPVMETEENDVMTVETQGVGVEIVGDGVSVRAEQGLGAEVVVPDGDRGAAGPVEREVTVDSVREAVRKGKEKIVHRKAENQGIEGQGILIRDGYVSESRAAASNFTDISRGGRKEKVVLVGNSNPITVSFISPKPREAQSSGLREKPNGRSKPPKRCKAKSQRSGSGKEERFHPYRDRAVNQNGEIDQQSNEENNTLGSFLSAAIAKRSRRVQ